MIMEDFWKINNFELISKKLYKWELWKVNFVCHTKKPEFCQDKALIFL